MNSAKVAIAKKYAPHVMDCAHAMNDGDLDRAWLLWENFKELDHPLAKAVAARLFLHDDRIAEARHLLLDAISKADEKLNASSQYLVEYCKVFLIDWPTEEDLERQIKQALSTNPSASLLRILPLFTGMSARTSGEN